MTDDITRRFSEAPTPTSRSRVVAAIVALLVSAAALAFLVVAFSGEERVPPAVAPTEIDAVVEGMRVTWPSSWTLVQLSEGSPDRRTWPMFQLTNFDPGLTPELLCPFASELPADGVVLYVQRDFDSIAESYDRWPVQIDPDAVTEEGCGVRTTAAWTSAGSLFQASLAFGPKASEGDRAKLLEVFADMEVVDTRVDASARRLDSRSRNTWYVAWGVRAAYPDLATTYLVGTDPQGRHDDEPARVVALTGPSFGFGWGPFDLDETFNALGDSKGPDSSFVQSWGVVSPSDVVRVLLQADDGRQLELTLGPALDRYGIPGRPTYVEFEPPLLGEYVAIGPDGEVLGRRPERNWPPPKGTPATQSPSPSPAEGQVFLPDTEAEENRQSIEAAIDGPVLMRGDNWNYPWVVYLSAEGIITYRDADSVSPMGKPTTAFSGTRFSFQPDPEILFVGVADEHVDWFGVERRDGSEIPGAIAPVPDSRMVVISVTVNDPRNGDRLVARDSTGRLLHDERF